MKKLFNNSLVLTTILAASISLQAEVVELSEVDGGCPSTEIGYLSNLTTYTSMEGTGTINPGWDADKYSFTPATDGVLKVHLNATGQELSMKIDTVCNGSGLFRSTKKADHEEQEFTIAADQTIEIALWDWAAGSGYAFDLNVEFTPDDATGEVPAKVSILQSSTSVDEGSANTYTLSLDKPSSTDTTVTVAIEHVTTSDDDVLEETRDITILAGESIKTFTVDTIDDDIEESSESFTLSISQTDNTAVIVNPTSNSVTTIIIDDDGTTSSDDLVIYEDAQNANTAGWTNLSSEAGRVTNITDVGSNRVIKLVGSTVGKTRASYTFKNDNGTFWNSTQNFIAKWDMKSDNDYEVFFVAKSSDNTAIDNYIGYVNKLPVASGFTFDSSTGYWSSEGIVYYSWGRYTYIVLGDTSSELTTITKDLFADANQELGIALTSIESMHVNVYGTSSTTLLLDNISLQKELTAPNTPPIANAQSVNVDGNGTVNITLTAIDSDDDNLTYSIVSDPTKGALTGEAPNLVYAPSDNEDATDSFTFKVNDGTVDSEIVTVSITITAVAVPNTPPVADDQNISMNKGGFKAITLVATDSDDDNLTYSIVGGPSNGTLDLVGAVVTYNPTADYTGIDSFTFKANDGTDDSNIATVNIVINDVVTNTPPVAIAQSITMDEDTNVTITLTGTDADDNNLTFAIDNQPSNGSVTLDGITAIYTPSANFFGIDSFTFKANDGIVDSAPATITITVNDIAEPNNAPVAEDQNVSLHENSTLDITLVATDSDDDNLTYSATQPSNGFVTIEGAIATYIPNSDYNGIDSFTFKANDGTDDSNTATVNITVIDVPITNDERTIYEDAEDGNTTGWVIYDNDPTGSVIDNVFDTDKNSSVVEFTGAGTTNGYRLGNNSGLTGDWNNTTQFNISWSMKSSERYMIYIRVETDEGWRYLQYTNSDSDDGIKNVRYIHHGLGSNTTDGTWKSFTRDLQADLKEFEPDNNITSVNAFLIRGSGRVDDISLFSNSVVPQNIAPVAEDQNVSLNENDTLEITLVATDENNDTLTYSVIDEPSNGSVTIVGANATYTPNADYDGTDSFTFQANDSNASSNTATVNIVINNVPNIISVTEDENLSEHFLGMTIDVTGDKTIVNGAITSDWDVDRYSFNADNLGETKITLKDSLGADMPFYVLRNYNEIVTGSGSGIYDLGMDFSVVTIMIVAESNTTSTYTLTIEAPNTEVSDANLYTNWIVAKNSSVYDLSIALESGNITKILTNKPINKDNTSQADAIYGTIIGHTSGFNETHNI